MGEIDAPERNQRWGKEATEALIAKVLQREVRLLVTGADRYGRIVGTLYLEDRNVNAEMVAEGHAWASTYTKNESMRDLERKAKADNVGLWSTDEPVSPSAWRGVVSKEELKEELRELSCQQRPLCKEMRSCDEAVWYLQVCKYTALDRDQDGIPCEGLCKGWNKPDAPAQ
ncbi:MAG: thermonuclease family protein [Gammaproteobacteria bacterium]|nr:thermonuclease family protein [Gammaproteobacteria bacterium]